MSAEDSILRCLRCKGLLMSSGVEPHRHICGECGQNYHLVLQLVPVESKPVAALPPPDDSRA